ncbi:unnamed protein product [Arabidopsis halleri]
MAKATKPSSIITVLFVFFLVISEMPEIKAQDSDCLKEYGGDVGFPFCAILIFPSVCYIKCRQDKAEDAKTERKTVILSSRAFATIVPRRPT